MPTTATQVAPRTVRILYAEDVRELRELVRTIFSRAGHHIHCSEDGLAAMEHLGSSAESYDLIITDHHMPRLNGLEFVERLRATGFAGRIIVFSSELDPAITSQYQRFNVDRVLFKPVYPSFLRQTVAELFAAPAQV